APGRRRVPPARPAQAAAAAGAAPSRGRAGGPGLGAGRPGRRPAAGMGGRRGRLRRLCPQRRGPGHVRRPGLGPAQLAPGPPAGGGTAGRGGQRPLAAQEMLSVLSLMQSTVPEAVTEALERPEASLAILLKNELLRGASRIGLPPEQVSISQDDEDAVDLVGML